MRYVYGLSSCLFFISAYNSIISNVPFFYKFFNVLLIYSSFIYNATKYKKFRLLDHSAICLIGQSFINKFSYSIISIPLAFLEYSIHGNINKSRIYGCCVNFAKVVVFFNKHSYSQLFVMPTVIGIIAYAIRNSNYNKDNKHDLILTIIWHIGVTYTLILANDILVIESARTNIENHLKILRL